MSNSSSSSFIVAYNDDAKLSLCLPDTSDAVAEIDVKNFFDMFEGRDWHSECSEVKADGLDNVADYLSEDDYSTDYYDLTEEKGWPSDKARRKIHNDIYEMLSKAMSEGKFSDVSVLKISYDDRFLRQLMTGFVKAGLMKEIQYGYCCEPVIEKEK